jgi:glucose-6-phosphate 1-dehydrogenase/6-phosphogluconate dehydrogenase (decarboxylating)
MLPTQDVPGIFTIFGITGDLAAKKIIPSLWHLHKGKRLPERFYVLGFARRSLSHEEFALLIKTSVEKAFGEVPAEVFEDFFKLFDYHAGTFEDSSAYSGLAEKISAKESSWKICASKLFYLAVPPSSYEEIFDGLASAKLNIPCGDADLGWSRILVEKPFGHDLKSAQELQTLLSKYFKKEQIYQIDHYLFKEIIQGIENFRFSNNLFENTWDHTNIERIDIRLLESIGVESRGSFYDDVGTLRDVGQNHLLTMLAAITMEYPSDGNLATAEVRKNRAEVLETLRPWTEELVQKQTYRAQYESYKEIKGVKPDSTTETYFALQTELTRPRWNGVPIYFEAGKRMKEVRKEIVLTLRHPNPCRLCADGPHGPNLIVFRLEPNDEIVIHFWTKKPGFEHTLEERTLSFFLYEKTTRVPYVEEYAKVIHAAMIGTQSQFVSAEEMEALWKFTDPIVSGWQKNIVPLESYPPDTTPHPSVLESPQTDTENRGREIGLIGLGKMGGGLALQLHDKGWNVHGFDPSAEIRATLSGEGIQTASSLSELVSSLPHPRLLWLMVPHQAVDDALKELAPLLEKGDTIIDGGNSPYKESIRRHAELESAGISFLDVGVSGGPSGARAGACIMVGGKVETYEKFETLFRDMSVPDGYAYVGAPGAGHFVKMVHNGIEYGMMQAIGEGFEVLTSSPLSIDVKKAAELYQHGSVIESRLVGWLASAYAKYGPNLDRISPTVASSGEGQWTVDAAHELGIPVTIIEGALEFRKHSADHPSYTGRVISSLRNQFGGHDASTKK